jgi:DNA-binding MltR family transcriptional regulator
LKEYGFTDNQIADLQQRKGVDENTAIKFIGYACDLLDETTNTRTADVLAKQGIYNVPTELAEKISAERKFAPYEYSKSDETKDIIGNALEDMEQLLSVVEQLQEEGVKVPIGDMDLAQMKADCKNLANLHWDMRKDDVDKAMAEFTKSDVNIPKNDVKNKDSIRKD